MSSLLFFLHIFLIQVLAKAPITKAWGKEGHYMVCKIAEQYLSETASKAVKDLLPESAGGDLAAACSWPDQVRFRYRWSSPLHYANTPGLCNFKYSRDCHNSKGEKDMCIVGAINNYTKQLLSYGDTTTNGYDLTESLMFLAHFMGDIHQPLHLGFEEDEGGNTVIVHWYRRRTNLHHVWDVDVIEKALKDLYSNDVSLMLKSISMNVTDEAVSQWKSCSARTKTRASMYASESIELACHSAYKDVKQNINLGDEYFSSRLPVVERRIAQGGVRLATLLDIIFKSAAGKKS